MASSMTNFALAYPDITEGMASRRASVTGTPSGSRGNSPRPSVDVERKLKDNKGKEKEKESSSPNSTSKADASNKSGDNPAVRPDPAAMARGKWAMLK